VACAVPHVPFYSWSFFHVPTEIFYNEDFTTYKVCTGSPLGEDPNCSDGLTFTLSVSDHLHYLGIEVGTYCNSADLSPIEQARIANAAALEEKLQSGYPLLEQLSHDDA